MVDEKKKKKLTQETKEEKNIQFIPINRRKKRSMSDFFEVIDATK